MCAVLAHSRLYQKGWNEATGVFLFLFSLGFSLYIFKMDSVTYILSNRGYSDHQSNTDQLIELFPVMDVSTVWIYFSVYS